ncbi:MAG: hypothetical protein V3V23_00585 [Dehalococcoidales bacterium]
MPQDYIVLVGVGSLFIILGLATVIWGKREEKSYFNSLSTRAGDTREFLEHWPRRPQPGALKIGGWIAVAIGMVMLLTGGTLLLLR